MSTEVRQRPSEAGYNIIEMMFVMAIMSVVAGMAAVQVGASRPGLKGDGAMRIVLSQMTQAREQAITQRRYMRVVFTQPNQVQIVREDTPLTTTTLSTVLLEGGPSFALISGLPDTPDAFGASSSIAFGVVTNIKFTPSGTLVDQNGNTINGSVFMSWSNIPTSARAVTVLGSTARLRAYRWDGASWKLV